VAREQPPDRCGAARGCRGRVNPPAALS
jgi:hypothetical protein